MLIQKLILLIFHILYAKAEQERLANLTFNDIQNLPENHPDVLAYWSKQAKNQPQFIADTRTDAEIKKAEDEISKMDSPDYLGVGVSSDDDEEEKKTVIGIGKDASAFKKGKYLAYGAPQQQSDLALSQQGVYEQENKNCSRISCKGKIKKISISNRSSFYCNMCQN